MRFRRGSLQVLFFTGAAFYEFRARVESLQIKLAYDTILGGNAETLEDKSRIQMNLDKSGN